MLKLILAALAGFFALEEARGETYTDLTNSFSLPYDSTLFDVEISGPDGKQTPTGQALFRPQGFPVPLFYSSKQLPLLRQSWGATIKATIC
jgi:hypothetical protein